MKQIITPKNLVGKIALVTGASKGIGAGIAKELAARGAAVAVNYASSREGADCVVAAIRDNGGRAVAVQGDVALAADVDRIFQEVTSALGRVDILVNNAGVFIFGPLESVTEAIFQRQFNVNVFGLLLATQSAVAQFGPDGGSVVNIGSASSQLPRAGAAVYGATKGAVNVITQILAVELGPKKIRVNAVLPGLTETEGAHAVGAMNEEFVSGLVDRTALGRAGTPQDIALVTAFLVSDDARWITGQLVTASGGLH
jgi:3-oxoacyl-[acyl-carrier protein] reductase